AEEDKHVAAAQVAVRDGVSILIEQFEGAPDRGLSYHACAATAVLLQPPGQQQAYRQHDQAGAKDQEETSDQIGLHLENSLQSGSPGSCAKSSSPSVICSFIQVCAVAAGCNPSGAIMPRPGLRAMGRGSSGSPGLRRRV